MRHTWLKILPFAVAATVAVSCSREESALPENPMRGGRAMVETTFLADGEAPSRTLLGSDGLSVLWAGDEAISIWDGTRRNRFSTTDSGESAAFSGSISSGSVEFHALYPYSDATVYGKSGGIVSATISLPSEQTATTGSFQSGLNIAAAYSLDSDRLHFSNLISAAKLTLSSANLDGHKIASISIENASYPLTGAAVVRWDSEGAASIAPASSGTVRSVSISAGGSALADGDYYLSVLPNIGGKITLTFLATDGWSATLTATVGSFRAGTIKNLGTVKGLSWQDPYHTYKKVSSAPADWSGRYLIVYEDGKVAFDGSLTKLDAAENGTAVSFEDEGTIQLMPADDKFYFDIAKSGEGYTIKSASGYYIGQTTDANGLASSATTAYTNTLSMSGSDVDIVSSGGAYLRFNSAVNQMRFRYYKSNTYTGQKAIQLYKYTGTLDDDTPAEEEKPAVKTDPLQYLHCYEVPAIDLANTETYTATGNERYSTYGIYPWYRYATTNPKQVVVSHTYKNAEGTLKRLYTSLVDKDRYAPLWNCTAYHKVYYPALIKRDDKWNYDPAIDEDWQQKGVSKSNSNYSKGHLTAAADRLETLDAMRMTEYYTNQVPQWQDSFNSGVWSSLEDAVRKAAPSNTDTLYAVHGPLYEGEITYLTSEDGKSVPVPSHMYKCLMYCSFDESGVCTGAKGLAYIYTNESHKGANYYDSSFETTIDAIEERAGFDFFANVPAVYQTPAENGTSRFSLQ